MQSDVPALSSAGGGVGDVLPVVLPCHLVTPALHGAEEVPAGAAALHGLGNGPHQPELPALPFLGNPVLPRGELGSRLLIPGQHREPLGGADLIAQGPEGLQGLGGLPQLQARLPADGVHHKVGMEVPGVPVGGHQHLEAGPSLPGKLQGHGVGLLQSHRLFGGEGLHVLVEVHALRLAIGALGGQKFPAGIVPQAVDAGDKPLAGDRVPGLFLLADVVHHPFHGPQGLLLLRDIHHRCHGLLLVRRHSSSCNAPSWSTTSWKL